LRAAHLAASKVCWWADRMAGLKAAQKVVSLVVQRVEKKADY
jgi:hypothetical protein